MTLVTRFVTLVLLSFTLLGCGGDNATHVRVRNGTDKDVSNVVINDNNFGDIKSGEASEYQILPMAYPDPYISLSIGTNRMKSEPAKYQGEQALGSGRFTFVVTIEDQKLRVKHERDK
ncbi:MAG: hypothetical protein JWQ71_247 [Pedosphaera sp.]|nr:hypothetical protein [Pedosphaera sp.]